MSSGQGLAGGEQVCGRVGCRTSKPSALRCSIFFLKRCCRAPKAKTNSSHRIKAAAMAGICRDAGRVGLVKKSRCSKVIKKRNKLANRFRLCPAVPDHIYRWSEKQLLEEYCLVVDGSAEGNQTCFRPESSKKEWRCCSIREKHLYVPDLPPPI